MNVRCADCCKAMWAAVKRRVAAFACLAAAGCGKIAVLMAPTGILANQHYELLSDWLSTSHIRCELLAGDIKGKKRQAALERLRFGLSRVVIGTHTLFQESVDLPPPALVVVDEQQRFGVEQRLAVQKRRGLRPPINAQRHTDSAHFGDDLFCRFGCQYFG